MQIGLPPITLFILSLAMNYFASKLHVSSSSKVAKPAASSKQIQLTGRQVI